MPPFEFCPLRDPGPHVPISEVNAISLFELFFDDAAVERIVSCTLAYAEHKKNEKKRRYDLFRRRKLEKAEIMALLGTLILLGIHKVRNHRKAWSHAKAQHLVKLKDLMTCQRFEILGCFLHIVTPLEEEVVTGDRLRKVRPLMEHLKANCLNYYQPLQHLSVDERMVKSKARCHMVQYVRNKPVKWGFKLWVVADTTGYTVDFNIYTGKDDNTEQGLTFNVVMELLEPFVFQGYEVFTDNYYSSPTLFDALLNIGICATGTLRTNRIGVPASVVALKNALEQKVERGTGYYVRKSSTVFICWKDVRVVTVISTAYLGHSEGTVIRKTRSSGEVKRVDVPIPIAVAMYNKSMGGVDKSDQYLAYHNVLRRTVRYWKTLFYHFVDIAVVNSFVIYNLLAHQAGHSTITENDFRDMLVMQIIDQYGVEKREPITRGRPPKSSCRIHHGSTLYAVEEKKRQYCKLTKKENFTQRKCPDCPFLPSLCQTAERDCHTAWHQPNFDEIRALWFDKQERKCAAASPPSPADPPACRRGRPRGAINRRLRRGNYRTRRQADLET